MNKATNKKAVDRIVKLGLLAAMGVLLSAVIRFPIFPAAPFLEYDMADVPILIGTFLYGPWWGLLLTAVVSILQGMTVSASSGWIGILMHFIATGGFVLIAGMVYRHNRTLKGALTALICGAQEMVLLMIPLNFLFTGYFMGTPQTVILDMLFPVIIPFNAIKAGINAVVTLLVYKTVGRVLKLEIMKAAPEQAD